MKKLFLLFGIIAFSAAAAQQNDLFDIQKHLAKKQAGSKKNDNKLTIPMPWDNKQFNLALNTPASDNFALAYQLPNGDNLKILSQDNMPCVVPDMSLYQTMPNAGKNFLQLNKDLRKIPNASPHFKMTGSR